MTRMEALIALKEAVKVGEWPGPDMHPHGSDPYGNLAYDAFHGSLDAAQAVQNSVLPNAWLSIDQVDDAQFTVSVYAPEASHGTAPCIARAWLLAILSALIAKEQKT